jgi:hypothetical protein
MNKDLYKENEELLEQIDDLVGKGYYETLQIIGQKLLKDGSHISLLASYYIYKDSWPMPQTIREEIEKKIKNETR